MYDKDGDGEIGTFHSVIAFHHTPPPFFLSQSYLEPDFEEFVSMYFSLYPDVEEGLKDAVANIKQHMQPS